MVNLLENCRTHGSHKTNVAHYACITGNVCGFVSLVCWFCTLLFQVCKNHREHQWPKGLSLYWAKANFTASLFNVFFVFSLNLPIYSLILAVYMPVVETYLLCQAFYYMYLKESLQHENDNTIAGNIYTKIIDEEKTDNSSYSNKSDNSSITNMHEIVSGSRSSNRVGLVAFGGNSNNNINNSNNSNNNNNNHNNNFENKEKNGFTLWCVFLFIWILIIVIGVYQLFFILKIQSDSYDSNNKNNNTRIANVYGWIALSIYSIEMIPQLYTNLYYKAFESQSKLMLLTTCIGKLSDFLYAFCLKMPIQTKFLAFASASMAYINVTQILYFYLKNYDMAKYVKSKLDNSNNNRNNSSNNSSGNNKNQLSINSPKDSENENENDNRNDIDSNMDDDNDDIEVPYSRGSITELSKSHNSNNNNSTNNGKNNNSNGSNNGSGGDKNDKNCRKRINMNKKIVSGSIKNRGLKQGILFDEIEREHIYMDSTCDCHELLIVSLLAISITILTLFVVGLCWDLKADYSLFAIAIVYLSLLIVYSYVKVQHGQNEAGLRKRSHLDTIPEVTENSGSTIH